MYNILELLELLIIAQLAIYPRGDIYACSVIYPAKTVHTGCMLIHKARGA